MCRMGVKKSPDGALRDHDRKKARGKSCIGNTLRPTPVIGVHMRAALGNLLARIAFIAIDHPVLVAGGLLPFAAWLAHRKKWLARVPFTARTGAWWAALLASWAVSSAVLLVLGLVIYDGPLIEIW
jgi:hypothetical protein